MLHPIMTTTILYKSNVIAVLPKMQSTQHGLNFPSRRYRKLRSVHVDILINVQEYVPVLECWHMFFRCLDSSHELPYWFKFNHLVQQYCEHLTCLVRYRWVFHVGRRMLVSNNRRNQRHILKLVLRQLSLPHRSWSSEDYPSWCAGATTLHLSETWVN